MEAVGISWIICAVVILGLLIPLFVLALPVVVIWAVVRLAGPRRSKGAAPEDTRIIQEIHQGLTKMEERIESLETILVDRAENDFAERL